MVCTEQSWVGLGARLRPSRHLALCEAWSMQWLGLVGLGGATGLRVLMSGCQGYPVKSLNVSVMIQNIPVLLPSSTRLCLQQPHMGTQHFIGRELRHSPERVPDLFKATQLGTEPDLKPGLLSPEHYVVSKSPSVILCRVCCKRKKKKGSWHVPQLFWILQTGENFTFYQGMKEDEQSALGLGNRMSCTQPWVILHSFPDPRWLPESSRWLLLHGKSQLAVQNLQKVATINGRREEGERLTEEVVSSYIRSEFASARTSNSVLDLFRTPAIRKVTCCLMLVWFSNSMAYYGLAMDLQKFGLSVYLVQVLFGVIDIPAMLVATTTMIYVGRRVTVASFLILAGSMVIANMFVPEDMQTLRTAQAALGKGCLASSFICTYLFTGELYPTEIRQMGMGFASVNARVGGLVAPLVTTLGEFSTFLPSVGFGATSILAGLAVSFLTETRNLPLVETIEATERSAAITEITHK
ncbi:solute carrier family 22 member 20 isoform X1 [Loxodonta africana]|uniref:solute carrier family 22 member 20 isoform X1 n=1 Tax=Loxodonta africana TaxID=9785 RepID=UPI0030CF8FA2